MSALAIENPYPGAKLTIRYSRAKSRRGKDKMVLCVTYGSPPISPAEVDLVAEFFATEHRLSANDGS